MELVLHNTVLVVVLGVGAGVDRVRRDVALLDQGEVHVQLQYSSREGTGQVQMAHVDEQPEEVTDEEDGDDCDENIGGLLPLAPDQHLTAHVPFGQDRISLEQASIAAKLL